MADLRDGRRIELGFRSSCEVDVRGESRTYAERKAHCVQLRVPLGR